MGSNQVDPKDKRKQNFEFHLDARFDEMIRKMGCNRETTTHEVRIGVGSKCTCL